MMILNNLKSIVALIVGAILVFLFMKNCSGSKSSDAQISTEDKTVVVKLTTKLDTVWVKKYIRIHDTINKPTLVRITDTVFVAGTKEIVNIPAIKREYKDVVKLGDSTSVSYTANTTGTLDKISIAYADTRADKTIIRTITKDSTTTITKHPGGLYIGIGSDLGLTQLSPSVTYIKNMNAFSVRYNVAAPVQGIKNIGVSYSRRLF